MKQTICTVIGLLGSLIVTLFGGCDVIMRTLIICMIIDYFSGLIVAGVFNNSPKTKNGALESKAGLKGLCRKGMILFIIIIANGLDGVLGTDYIRNTVIIGFIANEVISLVENAGLMGVPLPKVIYKAIDILNDKEKENE